MLGEFGRTEGLLEGRMERGLCFRRGLTHLYAHMRTGRTGSPGYIYRHTCTLHTYHPSVAIVTLLGLPVVPQASGLRITISLDPDFGMGLARGDAKLNR